MMLALGSPSGADPLGSGSRYMYVAAQIAIVPQNRKKRSLGYGTGAQLRLRADKLPSPNHCESRDFLLVFKNLCLSDSSYTPVRVNAHFFSAL